MKQADNNYCVFGANINDKQFFEIILDNIIIDRPDYNEYFQNLCLDAGYTGYYNEGTKRGYIVHIRL